MISGTKPSNSRSLSPEEAYTIQAENAIRAELGYGLRGDGSARMMWTETEEETETAATGNTVTGQA